SFTETATSYQLELRYGNAATGAAMTNNIAVDPLFTDSTYHLASHTFTPANSGVYNIGINGFGSGVDNSIRVDDASMVVVTGIKETDLSSNVTLMPNPATTELLVSAKLYGNSTLTVYNQLGQEVIKQNYNEPFRITLDIQSLKKGVYTLKISNADGVVVNKFVKQ
ncbi:MAG TPA: T9SS type A sorting domain-containing protein, partial [Bacteroidia bacterium]|nr:T9SS type A sorting domain-containing protein [Bacteroidia bacterium]